MECQNISSNYSQKQRRSHNSISILVVDDDTTCLSFVAALLKKLKYEVVTAKHANDALCALRIKGDAFDLVVSDVHMPDMNGFQLQQAITHEFNLPVVLMSVDSKEVVFSKGLESGAAFFISKPVSANDLKDLWQFASMRRRRRRRSEVVIEESRISDSRKYSKRKSQSTNEANNNTKKPKVIWTNALHYRFLEAIGSIGLERAVPKKILQVMNVPGLTRENVASHLQKYRLFLKRISDASHKLEIVGDNNEGSISNYSSSSTRIYNHSLHYFQDSATRFSYHGFPSRSFIDQSRLQHNQLIPITTSLLKPNINISRIDRSSQVGTTYSEAFPNDHYLNFRGNELQNNTVSLDQCLGDAFYYVSDSSNRQRLSSDHVIVGDCQDYRLPPPSNLFLVNDHDLEFSSLYNIMAADHQPSNPNHLHNQAQENQNGCENRASDDMENNTPYHLSFAKELERNDDDDLESLLAFGDYQIQSLEGI